jgi:hypothetical protein
MPSNPTLLPGTKSLMVTSTSDTVAPPTVIDLEEFEKALRHPSLILSNHCMPG